MRDGQGFDPDAAAPGFDFNDWELRRWRILQVWAARDGSEADRVALRRSWLADLAAFRRWNAQLWQAQRCNPTINRRHSGAGSSRARPLDRERIEADFPELVERLRDHGPLAVYQSAGCTPAECEVLAKYHGGRSIDEVAAERGISRGSTWNLARRGEARLARLCRQSTGICMEGVIA